MTTALAYSGLHYHHEKLVLLSNTGGVAVGFCKGLTIVWTVFLLLAVGFCKERFGLSSELCPHSFLNL